MEEQCAYTNRIFHSVLEESMGFQGKEVRRNAHGSGSRCNPDQQHQHHLASVRNTDYQASPQIHWVGRSEWRPALCACTSPPGQSDTHLRWRTAAPWGEPEPGAKVAFLWNGKSRGQLHLQEAFEKTGAAGEEEAVSNDLTAHHQRLHWALWNIMSEPWFELMSLENSNFYEHVECCNSMWLLNINFPCLRKRWDTEGVYTGRVVAGGEMVEIEKPFSKGIKQQQCYSWKTLLQNLYTCSETQQNKLIRKANIYIVLMMCQAFL